MQWNPDIEMQMMGALGYNPDGHLMLDGRYFTARGRVLITVDGLTTTVHRHLYTLLFGTPKHRYLIRICGIPTCINPHHFIESHAPRLPSENPRKPRSNGRPTRAQINAGKEQCPSGHFYSPENTYTYTRGGVTSRYCRTCRRNRNTARKKNHAR